MNETGNLKKEIAKQLKLLGIEKYGFTSYNDKGAIVCLFPYFTGSYQGNLSVYAMGKDYHKIIYNKLSSLAKHIENFVPDAACRVFSDIGPEIDRHLAYKAGLGFYGKNMMLINDKFGSYFFIGYILCNIKFEESSPLKKSCNGCNRCIKACPGGALGDTFDITRCASHISQKKGDLAPFEKDILIKSSLIFGCDICQRVCPHNDITPHPMAEFCEDIIASLSVSDIEPLSGREFQRKYKDRAFSWRGRKVIIRNLQILNDVKSK